MDTADTTVVRRTIEKHEPIEDLELNFRLFDEGIDPHDAIVIQDILESQGRIEYNTETRCFTTSYESDNRSDNLSNLS